MKKISQEVLFSKSGIASFLDDLARYHEHRSTGTPRKLSSLDEIRIRRTLKAGSIFSSVLSITLQIAYFKSYCV